MPGTGLDQVSPPSDPRRPVRPGRTVPVMRAGVALAAAGLVLAGCGGSPSVQGACAGPQLTVSSGEVAPGGEPRVQARNVWADCYDTGQPGTPPPQQDVDITLEPDDVPAGPATLHVGDAITPIAVAVP